MKISVLHETVFPDHGLFRILINGKKTNLYWWDKSYKYYDPEFNHRKKMQIRQFFKAIQAGIGLDWDYPFVDTCSTVTNYRLGKIEFIDYQPEFCFELYSVGNTCPGITEPEIIRDVVKHRFNLIQMCKIVNNDGSIRKDIGIYRFPYGYRVFSI